MKRLTFVRRAHGVLPEEFGPRWRDELLGLPAGSAPERLVQCVVRPGRNDRPFHGVSIEWFADDAAVSRYDEATTLGFDSIDSDATRRARVGSRTVFGQDLLDTWWHSPLGPPRLVMLGMIERAPSLTRDRFAEYWWHLHRPLANEVIPPRLQPPIYVHDYVEPAEDFPWDGVGEFYEDSMDIVRERTAFVAELDAIIADEARFLVRDTRFVLICDAEVLVAGR